MTEIRLHDDREAGQLLRRSPRTLARWRANGTGPAYVNIHGRPYYRERDLIQWIEARVVEPVRSRGK